MSVIQRQVGLRVADGETDEQALLDQMTAAVDDATTAVTEEADAQVVRLADAAGTAIATVAPLVAQAGEYRDLAATSEALAAAAASLVAPTAVADSVATYDEIFDLTPVDGKLRLIRDEGTAYEYVSGEWIFRGVLAQQSASSLVAAGARRGGPGATLDVDGEQGGRLYWSATNPYHASALGGLVTPAAGAFWIRPYYFGEIEARWWGCSPSASASVNRAAMQSATDFAIYAGRGDVRLPAGALNYDDTLHLGYGDSFRAVTVYGAGYSYSGTNVFAGTALVPTFTDRPAVNIQGARGSTLRRLGLIGKLATYIEANNMGGPGVPLLDDTIPAAWDVPALGGAALDSRYAPYAAVTIDAYSGVRPATSYPDVSYPAYASSATQYGKGFSSDVLLEDVMISGFTVAVANQPCDADGNADFTTLRRCYLTKCKWGVSVGNTQARNTHLDGVKANRLYSVLTNRRHGKQMGKFGGAITDLSVFGAINVVDFGPFYAGPVAFANFYGESLWRIGSADTSSTSEPSIRFIASEFAFSGQGPERGYPATVLSGGGTEAAWAFEGCTFSNFASVVVISILGATYDGCFFRHDTARAEAYEKIAHNALCGGLVTRLLKTPERARLKYKPYNLDTGLPVASPGSTAPVRLSQRKYGIPFWTESVSAAEETGDQFGAPVALNATAKSTFSASALVGRTWTFTYASRAEWLFLAQGPSPGDVLVDADTHSVFFVRARTGTTVTAELQNNYRSDGAGGWETMVPFVPVLGTVYIRNARFYTPPHYLRGDTTASSATIASVARDDGYAAWFDSEIAVGDGMHVAGTRDAWMSPSSAIITGRDQGAGTITLAGATGMRTQVRRRLDAFIRTPPANV